MGTLVSNRKDLRLHLKLSRLSDLLKTDGRLFHNVGADMLNDLQANVLSLVLGIISKSGPNDEQSLLLTGLYWSIS